MAQAILQLCRIVGREEFLRSLALPPEATPPQSLTPQQRRRLRELCDRRLTEITEYLLAEAAANDDITSAEMANQYLEERLAFLGDLLTEAQQAKARKGYRAVTAAWR